MRSSCLPHFSKKFERASDTSLLHTKRSPCDPQGSSITCFWSAACQAPTRTTSMCFCDCGGIHSLPSERNSVWTVSKTGRKMSDLHVGNTLLGHGERKT